MNAPRLAAPVRADARFEGGHPEQPEAGWRRLVVPSGEYEVTASG
ncbi:hypothetical protein AB0D14_31135 [Streptomyces sp. NPDC048484]